MRCEYGFVLPGLGEYVATPGDDPYSRFRQCRNQGWPSAWWPGRTGPRACSIHDESFVCRVVLCPACSKLKAHWEFRRQDELNIPSITCWDCRDRLMNPLTLRWHSPRAVARGGFQVFVSLPIALPNRLRALLGGPITGMRRKRWMPEFQDLFLPWNFSAEPVRLLTISMLLEIAGRASERKRCPAPSSL